MADVTPQQDADIILDFQADRPICDLMAAYFNQVKLLFPIVFESPTNYYVNWSGHDFVYSGYINAKTGRGIDLGETKIAEADEALKALGYYSLYDLQHGASLDIFLAAYYSLIGGPYNDLDNPKAYLLHSPKEMMLLAFQMGAGLAELGDFRSQITGQENQWPVTEWSELKQPFRFDRRSAHPAQGISKMMTGVAEHLFGPTDTKKTEH